MFWTILLLLVGSFGLIFTALVCLLAFAAVRSDLVINKLLLEGSFEESQSSRIEPLNASKQDEQEKAKSRTRLLNAG